MFPNIPKALSAPTIAAGLICLFLITACSPKNKTEQPTINSASIAEETIVKQ